MSVQITEISHNVFEVNGKTIYKDGNGNWVAPQELTTAEQNSFKQHLKSLEKN